MKTSQYSECKSAVFSIIMPCYNSENYLRGAIDSLVNQTYSNWELIAVNDGSTDSTLEILKDYESKDSRIKVFSKDNGGYVSAVNFGLERITGEYFLIMGSDDSLSSTLFFELNKSLFANGNHPDCIAWKTVQVVDGIKSDKSEKMTDFQGEVYESNISFAKFVEKYPEHSKIFSCRDTSKCYKRTLLGDLCYFGEYGYDADGIFSMLLCHRACSFAAVPVDGYLWTLRSDSLSGKKPSYSTNIDRIKNWTQFYEILLGFDSGEITNTEKWFLDYFFDVVKITWHDSRPFFSDYKIIRNAIGLIGKISKLTKQRVFGKKNKLLLYSPILWKICFTVKTFTKNRGG